MLAIAPAIEAMGRGAAEVVRRLHAEGRLDAIGALGGTGGTAIATRAMRALPIGVPKLMVSTVASGDTSHYVGTTDVTMMHSVVDVAGNQSDLGADLHERGSRPRGAGRGVEAPRLGREAARSRRRCGESPHRASRRPESGSRSSATTCSSSTRPALGGRSMEELIGGRPRRRRARRHPDRARRRAPGRNLAVGARAARDGRAPRHPAGRLARRARRDRDLVHRPSGSAAGAVP